MKDYFSIYLFNDVIFLSIIQNEWDIKINIYNDEIICDIKIITDEYQKDICEVIKCTSKIKYTLLKNIMYCMFKICDKKTTKIIRKKKRNK